MEKGMQRNFHLQKRMANISASNAISYFPNRVMYIDISRPVILQWKHLKNCCCQNCGKEFLYECRLNLHMKTHEYEIMRWCCEGCGKDYKRKDHFDKDHDQKLSPLFDAF